MFLMAKNQSSDIIGCVLTRTPTEKSWAFEVWSILLGSFRAPAILQDWPTSQNESFRNMQGLGEGV
jgi:uncharacterized protein CbrC (UPF0167 family)